MNTFFAAIVLLILSSSVTTASADEWTAQFVGQWSGAGILRPNNFDPPERAKCRMKGTRIRDNETRFSGRCATVSGSGPVSMEIRLVPGTSRYEIIAQLPDLVDKVRLNGAASNGAMVFTLAQPLKVRGRTIRSTIQFSFPQEHIMQMSQTVRDTNTAEQVEALNMVFEKSP